MRNNRFRAGSRAAIRLTPLYDVLSAQSSLDARQIERKQMKLALAVGAKNHYKIDGIQGRHFFETGRAAGFSKTTIQTVIDEVTATAGDALERLADELPPKFPKAIHASVSKDFAVRLRVLLA